MELLLALMHVCKQIKLFICRDKNLRASFPCFLKGNPLPLDVAQFYPLLNREANNQLTWIRKITLKSRAGNRQGKVLQSPADNFGNSHAEHFPHEMNKIFLI